MSVKICFKCLQLKPRGDFNSTQQSKGRGWCRVCSAEYKKQHREENKELISAQGKVYREANRESLRVKQQAYREANRESLRVKQQAYRDTDFSRHLFNRILRKATLLNLAFDLTQDFLESLLERTHCPLLETVFNRLVVPLRPSLDRIDPGRGYTQDNIWIVSYRANRSKNDLAIQEYTNLVEYWKNPKALVIERYDERDINLIKDRWGKTVYQRMLSKAREAASKQGFPIGITVDDLKKIGVPKYDVLNGRIIDFFDSFPNNPQSASLDKIEPRLGYVRGNIQIVSRRLNLAKNDLTLFEAQTLLKNWSKKLNVFRL